MANIKSAMKRAELSRKRAVKNAAARSTMKTAIKKFNESLKSNSTENIQENFKKAISLIDRGAQKGLIHRNTAARKKSKLAKKFNSQLQKLTVADNA